MRIERTYVIDAAPEAIWAALADYMNVDNFCPGISRVEALTHDENGLGSRRRNHFPNGSSLVEEAIAWDVGKKLVVRLTEMEGIPLKTATGDIAVQAHGGKTKVVWGITFTPKYGPLGWVMGQTLLKMGMGGVITSNLKGLEAYVTKSGSS